MKGDFVFAIPGDIDTPTGGYAYDRRMIAELRALGWRPEVLSLGEGFPKPTALVKAAAHARLCEMPKGRPIVIDGLAFGVLPEAGGGAARNPSADRAGASSAGARKPASRRRTAVQLRQRARGARPPRPGRDRRPALRPAQALVAGLRRCRRTASRSAFPGTDRAPVTARPAGGTVAMLTVGTPVPRKGYDVLMEALAELIDLPWRLTIVGDCSRDPATTARLRSDIEDNPVWPRASPSRTRRRMRVLT